MGSWSEACGFSGMEIGEGEVAYCLLMKRHNGSLNDGAFHHYSPVTTLLRGTYNDYGYLHVEDDEALLAIFNEQAQMELKNGDDFSLDHISGRDGDLHRWWMHGRAFDFMPTISPDFPYASSTDEDGNYISVPIKNIGEAQDVFYASVQKTIDKAVADVKEAQALEGSDKAMNLASIMFEMSMSRAFGYRTPGLSTTAMQKDLLAGIDTKPRLTAARRITTLGRALGELRKPLAPCESTGPQHGGAEASLQFANFLIEAQTERAKRWDY